VNNIIYSLNALNAFAINQSNYSIEFMQLQEGENLVRLAGSLKVFKAIWTQGKRFIIPTIYESEIMKQGHSPKSRWAINCFDRNFIEKEAKLKILESGIPLFTAFSVFWKETSIIPGGNDGPDWIITKDSSKKQKPYTIYSAIAANKGNPVPFTKEENETIKLTGDSNLETLYDDDKAKNKLINHGLLPGLSPIKPTKTTIKAEIIPNTEEEIKMKEPTFTSTVENNINYKILCPICNETIELLKENLKSYPIILCPKCSSKFKH